MTTLLRYLIILLAVAGTAAGASAAPGRKIRNQQTAETADSLKADYIYLEAKRHALQKRYDAYFELMDYAHRLNPDDRLIGMDLGIYYLTLDTIGSTRGLDLMKAYVDENPDDLYNNYTYASIAQRLGHTEQATEAWRRLHERYPERDGVTLQYASILRRSDDSTKLLKAIELFDSLQLTGGDPVQITGMKASVYLQMSDTAAAIGQAQRLLASAPDNSSYNLFVGNIYASLLDSDSAIVYFDRAVELDPANGLAYYARANYYNERNDSIAYDREVFDALHQPDLDLDIKLAMLRDYVAALYTDSLQQPRISELFATLNAQHPHQSDIYDLYADYLIAVHDWKGAAEQVSYSLDVHPSDLKKWRALASLYLQMRDFGRTSEAAARGLHFYPDDVDLYQLQATGYLGRQDYDRAKDIYRTAIARFETSDSINREGLSELYTGLGDTFHSCEQSDSAFKAYYKAIDLDPDNLTALNNLAYGLACEGRDLQEALVMTEKVCAVKSYDATSLDTYAWVLFKLKDYKKARQVIDLALECEEDPGNDLLEHAGDIYFMDGDPDSAIDFWKKALKLDPDNELLRRKVTHKTYFYK